MNEELTAKEVLETICDICKDARGCGKCDLGIRGICYLKTESLKLRLDEIIKTCEQWKANRKPIETEWVHVCRIIEDTGSSKRCVYEEEIDEDEILPFDTYDRIAEEVLKEYISKHEGNFFAVVERLCRRAVR